mgnify:CR=1 FL=1
MSKQFAWSTQVSAPPFELPTRVGSFAVLKSFLGSANTHAPPGMGALGGLGGEGGDGGAPGGEGGCPGRVGGEGGLTGGRGGLGAGLGGLGGGEGGLGAGLGGLGGGRGLGGTGGLGGLAPHLKSGVPGLGTVNVHKLHGKEGDTMQEERAVRTGVVMWDKHMQHRDCNTLRAACALTTRSAGRQCHSRQGQTLVPGWGVAPGIQPEHLLA